MISGRYLRAVGNLIEFISINKSGICAYVAFAIPLVLLSVVFPDVTLAAVMEVNIYPIARRAH